jgi:hypothetical protein
MITYLYVRRLQPGKPVSNSNSNICQKQCQKVHPSISLLLPASFQLVQPCLALAHLLTPECKIIDWLPPASLSGEHGHRQSSFIHCALFPQGPEEMGKHCCPIAGCPVPFHAFVWLCQSAPAAESRPTPIANWHVPRPVEEEETINY